MTRSAPKPAGLPLTTDWRGRLTRLMAGDRAQEDRIPYQDLNPGNAYSALTQERRVEKMKRAAVLVPVIDHEDEPTILFTVRSSDMPSHAGQISFPGGGVHPEDQSLVETALRETEEEVGIPRASVEVLGEMGVHYGGMAYAVTPVVGIVPSATSFLACEREVDEIFEVPLSFLLNTDNHIIEERTWRAETYRMYAMPYERWHIWGLTAGMVYTLMTLLNET